MRDPETARLLSPTHPIGCKRMCVDTGYYETFNRPNVRLVDVSEHPIDEITPAGLKTNGSEFAFDALVLATGFDAITGTLMRLDLRGRGGMSIQQKWSAGPLNYLGLMIAGFPNLFNVIGPGCPAAFTNVRRVHRAPRGLDRRLHRLSRRARPRDDRGNRAGGSRLDRARQRGGAEHRAS